MRQVDIAGLGIEGTTGTMLLLLRERDLPHRVLPIFMGEAEAMAIHVAISGDVPPRPQTFDLMAAIVRSVEARVERVEVTELRGGTFVAELALLGPGGSVRLDCRPSDAIALAVRVDAPLFVSESVLEEAHAVAVPHEAVGDESIEACLAEFRSELDRFDPAQLDLPHDQAD